MTRLKHFFAAGTLVLLAGCSREAITETNANVLDAGTVVLEAGTVRVTLEVDPDTVDRPGVAVARLKYINTTDQTVVLTSGWGCLAFASVYQGATRLSFPSTDYGCTAAASNHDLRPGDPIVVEWPLAIGGSEGVDVPPGTYRFVAQLNTHADSLERVFVVR